MNPIITEPHALELRAFGAAVVEAVRALYPDAGPISVSFEAPRRPEFGDFSTNAAFPLAKHARRSPQEVATAIVEQIRPRFAKTGAFASIEPLGGFINVRFADEIWQRELARMSAGIPASASARRARLARVRERESYRTAGRRPRAFAFDRRRARQRHAFLRLRRVYRVDHQRRRGTDRTPRAFDLRPIPPSRRSEFSLSRRWVSRRVPRPDRARNSRSRRRPLGLRPRVGVVDVFRDDRTRRDRRAASGGPPSASACATTSGRANAPFTMRAAFAKASTACANSALPTNATGRRLFERPTLATTRTASSSAATDARPTTRSTSRIITKNSNEPIA